MKGLSGLAHAGSGPMQQPVASTGATAASLSVSHAQQVPSAPRRGPTPHEPAKLWDFGCDLAQVSFWSCGSCSPLLVALTVNSSRSPYFVCAFQSLATFLC